MFREIQMGAIRLLQMNAMPVLPPRDWKWLKCVFWRNRLHFPQPTDSNWKMYIAQSKLIIDYLISSSVNPSKTPILNWSQVIDQFISGKNDVLVVDVEQRYAFSFECWSVFRNCILCRNSELLSWNIESSSLSSCFGSSSLQSEFMQLEANRTCN